MNPVDILYYGNTKIHEYIDILTDEEMEADGVCGWWSVKEIMAHLASFEYMLNEVIGTVQGEDLGPYLRAFSRSGQEFNDIQVANRQGWSPAKVLAEYEGQHRINLELTAKISPEMCRKPGTLPWYGKKYSLDDFIVYTFYGHKREHGAQIGVYREKIGR